MASNRFFKEIVNVSSQALSVSSVNSVLNYTVNILNQTQNANTTHPTQPSADSSSSPTGIIVLSVFLACCAIIGCSIGCVYGCSSSSRPRL